MKYLIILLLPFLLTACDECTELSGPPGVYTYSCTGNAHVVTVQQKEVKK